jgi:hypothetical protein
MCRKEIVEFNGLNLLAEFLNEKPASYFKRISEHWTTDSLAESEASACERVLQKTLIGITRLCKEKQLVEMFFDLGVIDRILFLVEHPLERNNSDSVLLACLVGVGFLFFLNFSDSTDSFFDRIVGCLASSFGRLARIGFLQRLQNTTAHQAAAPSQRALSIE